MRPEAWLRVCVGFVWLCVLGACEDSTAPGTEPPDSSVDTSDLDASRGDGARRDPDELDASGRFDAHRNDASERDTGAMESDDSGAIDSGSEQCVGETEPANLDCPARVVPQTGCFEQKGACCFRRSNAVRRQQAALAGATSFRREYRIQHSEPQNHSSTLGLQALLATAQRSAEREEQSLLWAFEGPIDGAGNDVDGAGINYVGPGVYNCDGTYSFFGSAAPPRAVGSDDPARWSASTQPTTIDASATGIDRAVVAWADRDLAHRLAYAPVLNSHDFTLDWERVTMGFQILSFDTGSDEDCFGSRTGGGDWSTQGDFVEYVPLIVNDRDEIAPISQTLCQLMAFSIVSVTPTMPNRPQCDDARCIPGTANCPWVKLPDSLCPLDAVTGELDVAEAAKWTCHVGAENNPDGAPTNCTATAPTGVLNPDEGATSEGQCCDPLGQSATLPACNAWVVHSTFVAAAAEITAAASNAPQASCLR